VLVDPVFERVDEDLALLNALRAATRLHPSRPTSTPTMSQSAARLKSLTGSRIACPAMDEIAEADVGVSEVEPLLVGNVRVQPLYTPGTPTPTTAISSMRAAFREC
jgi:hypothetical protein